MAGSDLYGEDRLLAWLRKQLPGRLLGDDAAILPEAAWAVSMDAQIAGVHFPEDLDPAWIARRLVAINLSDLAAMGAEGAYAFLSLAAPASFDHRRFFRAFRRAAGAHGLELAGGDLSRQSRPAAVLTVLGRRPRGGRWLRRSEARAGDRLWLGGTVGEAALGLALLERGATVVGRSIVLPAALELGKVLARAARKAVRRQLQPRPQIELGNWLSRRTSRGAAIDLSDSLAKDLHRLCRESGVGAEVHPASLSLSPRGEALAAKLGLDVRDLALFGGEDYVLLFTLPPSDVPAAELDCRPIGTIRRRRKIIMIEHDVERLLPDRGWDHLEPSPERRSSQ